MANMLNGRLKAQLDAMKEAEFILESVNGSIMGSDTELSDVDENEIMDVDSVPSKAMAKVEAKIEQLIDDEEFDEELDLADEDAFFEDVEDEDFDDEDIDDLDDFEDEE